MATFWLISTRIAVTRIAVLMIIAGANFVETGDAAWFVMTMVIGIRCAHLVHTEWEWPASPAKIAGFDAARKVKDMARNGAVHDRRRS